MAASTGDPGRTGRELARGDRRVVSSHDDPSVGRGPGKVTRVRVGEALAQALTARAGGNLTGSRVLIPSAEDARDALAAGLRASGATVDVVPVYRTVPVQTDLSGLAADLVAGRIDAVTFTSSSTVRSFVDLVGPGAARASRFVAAVIGPVTAGTARELGLADVVEAAPHSVPGLVDALVRRFA